METIDLSNFFKTKAQATDFVERLATLSEMTYQTNFQLDNALMEQFGIAKKEKFATLLRDAKVDNTSATALKAFFDTLRTTIAALPVLPITLAFEPKEQTLTMLADWFMLNVQKQVLFDISVDQKLIAGAALTFNGKFTDYSIKTKFETIVTTLLTQIKTPQKPHDTPVMQNSENMHLGR